MRRTHRNPATGKRAPGSETPPGASTSGGGPPWWAEAGVMTDATQTRRRYNGAAQVADTPLGPGARQPGKGKGGLVPAQRAGSVLGALTTCDYGTPTITPVSSAPGQHRQGEPQTAYNTFIMSMLEIFLRRVTPALPPGSDAAALAYLWPRPRPVGPWLAPEVCGLCPQWGGGCCAAQGVHSRRDCGTIAFEFPIRVLRQRAVCSLQ